MTITAEPEGRQHLPRDYRAVPYNLRPLGMRVLERTSGQPMEEIIALLWYKYRSVNKVTKAIGVNIRTMRRWTRQLGLVICLKCSARTGLLISSDEAQKCNYCGGYLCMDCTGKEPIEHRVGIIP